MSAIVTMFAIGVVLAAVELIVPGGLLGLIAGMFFLGGVVTAFVQLGPVSGAVASGVALGLGALTLYLELVLLPKTRLARKFSMTETVAGRSQPAVADPAAVVGREAAAVTALAPSGYVEVDGRRYEAFCRSGFAEGGARLRVVDVDNFRLVVTSIKESS